MLSIYSWNVPSFLGQTPLDNLTSRSPRTASTYYMDAYAKLEQMPSIKCDPVVLVPLCLHIHLSQHRTHPLPLPRSLRWKNDSANGFYPEETTPPHPQHRAHSSGVDLTPFFSLSEVLSTGPRFCHTDPICLLVRFGRNWNPPPLPYLQ